MHIFYLEPSTLIWDEEHFINNPHMYDDVINDVIQLLEIESTDDIQLAMLYDFVENIIDYPPFDNLYNGHWKNSHDFVTQVTAAITKWMSTGLCLDDQNPDGLLDVVSCVPSLVTARDQVTWDIRSCSASCLYNIKQYPVISFNPLKIDNVTLTKFNDDGEEAGKDPRPLFNTFDRVNSYLNDNRLICEFSPKHHPISGWGSKMPHEDQEMMQELLEQSSYEEQNEYRVRYAYGAQDQQYYAFRVTNGLIFHPYPVTRAEIPNAVARELDGE
ncbi:hypothetical protein AAFM83_002281 [Vibrio parahaemolyticus]